MENNTTPRLLAAAKEFNIGKDTLVSFLTEKGFEINFSNPNTKLTEEMYDALAKEFKRDKLLKKKINNSNRTEILGLNTTNSSTIFEIQNFQFKEELTKLLFIPEIDLVENQKLRIKLLERLVTYEDLDTTKVDNLVLDLSNLNLVEIPFEIYRISNLRRINLRGNLLKSIDGLTEFQFLEEVDVSDNLVQNFSALKEMKHLKIFRARNNNISDTIFFPPSLLTLDISRNKITDILNIKDCQNLMVIDISFNVFLENIQPLFECRNLKVLISKGNSVEKIVGIQKLTHLEHLDLSGNRLNNIEPIFSLHSLLIIYLNDNAIEVVDGIEQLLKLSRINLNNNKIYDISPLEPLLKRNRNSININISGNQISDIKMLPDVEENHLNLLIEYFGRRNSTNKAQVTPINFIQLLVLGNGETGKTSLLNVVRETYLEREKTSSIKYKMEEIKELPTDSTHGSIHYYWHLRFKDRIKDTYIVLIKDFGGQEYYHHFHPVFYHPKAIYWVVNGLNNSNDIRLDNGNFLPTYWYYNISHYLKHHHSSKEDEYSKNIWLLNTKSDIGLYNQNIRQPDVFDKNFKICSLNSTQFSYLNFLERQKYLSVRHQLYYELREQIEKTSNEMILKLSLEIFQNLNANEDDITSNQFVFSKNQFKKFLFNRGIGNSEDIENNFETILSDLRYLGICLYFPTNEKLKNSIYLYPQKIASSIFNGILSKINLVEKKGIIGKRIVGGKIEIQNLLSHFEIIFKDGKSLDWIVPQYLPKYSSEAELISLATDGLTEELIIRFADFMPQGLMSRLICYFGRNPYQKWYWRDGIFFTHNLTANNTGCGKGLICTNWENGFRISIKTDNKSDLERIFLKVLLSYYNKPLYLNDEIPEFEEESNYNELELPQKEDSIYIYNSWLENIKSDPVDISLSLNGDKEISIDKFKQTIISLVDNGYAVDDYTFNPYLYIKKYLPFLQYLIDTKDFQSMFNPKKIFISYSHKDSDVRDALDSHLKLMVRTGVVSTWHDMKIDIGTKWDNKIEQELKSSDVVILLLSNDFFASEYIWSKELPIIEEKLKNGSSLVIPILCRHCISDVSEIFNRTGQNKDFGFEISSLQSLPIKNQKLVPIHSEAFKYIDEAYEQISKKLVELISKTV